MQLQDSSEEEEEEDNEYDLTDKFIAQEDEEDEEGDGSEQEKRRKHRHKRRREKSPELDDDDYQLLAENQVTVCMLIHGPDFVFQNISVVIAGTLAVCSITA